MDQAESLRQMMNQAEHMLATNHRKIELLSLDSGICEGSFVAPFQAALVQQGILCSVHSSFDSDFKDRFDSHLWILTPESLRTGEALRRAVNYLNKKPVKNIDIIVSSVTSGREGLRIYQEFQGHLKKIRKCDTKYIGHLFRSREFLIDLSEGLIELDQVSLIAQSFQSRWCEFENKNERDRKETMRFSKNRFRIEPVRRKPRIWVERFWRALLGERD